MSNSHISGANPISISDPSANQGFYRRNRGKIISGTLLGIAAASALYMTQCGDDGPAYKQHELESNVRALAEYQGHGKSVNGITITYDSIPGNTTFWVDIRNPKDSSDVLGYSRLTLGRDALLLSQHSKTTDGETRTITTGDKNKDGKTLEVAIVNYNPTASTDTVTAMLATRALENDLTQVATGEAKSSAFKRFANWTHNKEYAFIQDGTGTYVAIIPVECNDNNIYLAHKLTTDAQDGPQYNTMLEEQVRPDLSNAQSAHVNKLNELAGRLHGQRDSLETIMREKKTGVKVLNGQTNRTFASYLPKWLRTAFGKYP